jgi:hypothetical protein
MAEALSWTHPIVVADLPEEGTELEFVPDDENRAALARYAGVLAVNRLIARLGVRPDGRGGATLEGTMEATVRQTCVVTLEPFDNAITQAISVRFASAESSMPERAGAINAGEDDPPDPLIGGRFDIAAVIAEFLVLAVDPYPRKPGAVFIAPAAGGAAERSTAFAALAELKRRADKKG